MATLILILKAFLTVSLLEKTLRELALASADDPREEAERRSAVFVKTVADGYAKSPSGYRISSFLMASIYVFSIYTLWAWWTA